MMESIFENIAVEYHQPIDKHSKQVVLSNLELLLTPTDFTAGSSSPGMRQSRTF